MVQGPESFSENCSKGFKRFQTMNKGLIKPNDHSFFIFFKNNNNKV